MNRTETRLEEISESHWNYIEKILKAVGTSEILLSNCKLHYTSAFKHGYRHGVEDREKSRASWYELEDKNI